MSAPLRFVSGISFNDVEIRSVECAICIEKLVQWDIWFTPCGHCFHEKCIRTWLHGGQSCPQCRKPLATLQLRHMKFAANLNVAVDFQIRELNDEIETLRLKIEMIDEAIYYEQGTAPALSENELKHKIENLKMELSQHESERNIIRTSQQDKTLPNDIESLKHHVLQIQGEFAKSIEVERDKQLIMTAKLNLELENIRKLEKNLKENEKKEQLQEQQIEELNKKLSDLSVSSLNFSNSSQLVTSTQKKIESKVSERISSPDEPIARRTRNRLRNENK